MENKGAAECAKKEEVAAVPAPESLLNTAEVEATVTVTVTESANGRFGQFKVGPAVGHYWASLKNKARSAGEYVKLSTRQGITMFGEPKIGPSKSIVDRF